MPEDDNPWAAFDLGGDGSPDAAIAPVDTNHDGIPDTLVLGAHPSSMPGFGFDLAVGAPRLDGGADYALRLDFDGDGRAEVAIGAHDSSGDWWPDTISLDADLNADGSVDLAARGADVWGGLFPDVAELKLDLNGDGAPDFDLGIADVGIPIPLPGEIIEHIWGDAFAAADRASLLATDPLASFDSLAPVGADAELLRSVMEIHGTPERDLALWEMQDGPVSCAVASTSMILRSAGIDAPEPALAEAFERFGIYDPLAGTRPELIDEVVNFLAARDGLDIRAQEIHDFTADDLTRMLDRGLRPLVALDAAELYPDAFGAPGSVLDQLFNLFVDAPQAGHAVQVTGIVDHGSDGRMVVLNDPGRPDGAGIMVPLSAFMAAADDFRWTAVVVSHA